MPLLPAVKRCHSFAAPLTYHRHLNALIPSGESARVSHVTHKAREREREKKKTDWQEPALKGDSYAVK